ncbi:MAG TPA: hypothetical protein DDW49_04540 [Deltaproteobacteria bacterium]|nr:MAG: hypothetical protein A2048_04060 [Deltaproteobacteria bacterium GWA2_45_12]HBF12648.1 hypothetical protein [Deltaproteobacteria bacterium]
MAFKVRKIQRSITPVLSHTNFQIFLELFLGVFKPQTIEITRKTTPFTSSSLSYNPITHQYSKYFFKKALCLLARLLLYFQSDAKA